MKVKCDAIDDGPFYLEDGTQITVSWATLLVTTDDGASYSRFKVLYEDLNNESGKIVEVGDHFRLAYDPVP